MGPWPPELDPFPPPISASAAAVSFGFDSDEVNRAMQENEAGAATSADDGEVVAAVAPPPGKHRISAELKRLEQEARFLEKELEEVEKTEKVSAALQEFLFKVETKPDPLLPVTNGPVNPSWDRWFEGPQDMRRCKCWIM